MIGKEQQPLSMSAEGVALPVSHFCEISR